MMCTGVLIGLYVFSLSYPGVSLEDVDMNTLPKIIRYFESKYKPSEQSSKVDGRQYAVAINVPAGQCGNAFSEENFLSGDDTEKVKSKLSASNLYEGEQLVAATPKGKNTRKKIHSERALLMCDDSNHAVTPVQNLLNKDKNGCVVFYTYNSPCLEYCLNQARDDNIQKWADKQKEGKKTIEGNPEKKCILKSLSVLTNHSGPKAFVFSKVYREDINKTNLVSALKEVAKQVPLYKCDTNVCVKCLDNNQNFNNQCLSYNITIISK